MQRYEVDKALELATVFLRRLKRDLFCGRVPLKSEFALAQQQTPFEERMTLQYRKIEPGEVWGHTWQTGWFHLTGRMQPQPEADVVPVIRLNTGSEALLFSNKGEALTGLTSCCWFENDFVRDEYFPPLSIAGKKLDYWCAVTANMLAGMHVDFDPPVAAEQNGDYCAVFKMAEAAWMRTEVEGLRQDIRCLLEMAASMSATDYRLRSFARCLNEAETTYADAPENAREARQCLMGLLARSAYADALEVTAVGHAHIDTAYMWPIREATQKCARTYSTQLEMIRRYPQYVFGASQPQHYLFIKESYPEIYERIKQAVQAGRWELQGGMWVEADLNMPDGESLVRQFLHGKNFFREEFGIEVKNAWLPDVFGYTGAFPQIMKLAGCDSFVSTKIAVGDGETYPYHTFRWRGIDGTEVLVHRPPEGVYSSFLKPKSLIQAQDTYAESAECGEFLSLFGLGDGGGGPVREDMEIGQRLANLEGAPKVRFGAAQPLLERLRSHWNDLPTWQGELYLFRHRATSTNIARYKRANRKNEQLLATVEFLCASLLHGKEYPHHLLDQAWKLLLLHQFHDIMAGSAIDEAYQETERDYGRLRQLCQQAIEAAQAKLTTASVKLTLVNTLNCCWHGVVTLPAAWGRYTLQYEGQDLPAVCNEEGAVSVEVTLSPLSFTTFTRGKKIAKKAICNDCGKELVLENAFIRYTLNRDLQVVSAYDKEVGRELIPQGKPANTLLLYRDYPNNYEAWDIERHYRDGIPEIAYNASGKIRSLEGAMGKELEATLQVGQSTIRQRVQLDSASKLLTFRSRVEWHERRKLLRVRFPTVLTSEYGTYDIQFGSLRRPTGENTLWELARFETVQHQFMDLSENGYGVAVLNDCKYGGKVYPHDLELSLLRSARYPAMHTEEGIQEFSYGLLPHSQAVGEARLSETAQCFNRDPLILNGYRGNVKLPFTIDTTDVLVSAFKQAERGEDLILRLVERHGCFTKAVVTATAGYALSECDLLEWKCAQNAMTQKMTLEFHPFEIKTLRIRHQ